MLRSVRLICGLVCEIEKIFKIRAKNRTKNKLVLKNSVTRGHGSFSLRVMGSWSQSFPSRICARAIIISRNECRQLKGPELTTTTSGAEEQSV